MSFARGATGRLGVGRMRITRGWVKVLGGVSRLWAGI